LSAVKEGFSVERAGVMLYAFNDRIEKIGGWFVAVFMAGMFISILMAITSRFIIKIPIPWTEELSRYLMVWTAFIAGSLGLRKGSHVGIRFLVQKVPKPVAKWMGLITNIALLIFFLFLIIEGVRMAALVAGQRSPVLNISMAWVYASLPTGAVLFAAFVLQSLVGSVRDLPDKKG
jgi:TRAP-type C4-dicarboxylate transport system permease small subunit